MSMYVHIHHRKAPNATNSDIAPAAENTYNSQNTFELTIAGSKKTTYIYMGDSWDSKGGPDSNFVWLPISVDTGAKKLTLQYHAQWKIDVATGEVKVPSVKRRYEAEHAALEGRAVVARCEHCVGKRGVQQLNGDGLVKFENVTALGGLQWVQFHYHVLPSSNAEAWVSVNDGPAVNISALNHRAGFHDVVPIQLDLNEGSGNTVTFGTSGGEGVVLDGIELVED